MMANNNPDTLALFTTLLNLPDISEFVEWFNNRRCYGLSSAVKLFLRLIIDTLGMVRFAPKSLAYLTIPRKDAKSQILLTFITFFILQSNAFSMERIFYILHDK